LLSNTTLQSLGAKYGITKVGVAKAGTIGHGDYLDNWLKNGFHGEMSYLSNYAEMRKDVSKLLPGAQSIISCYFNYYQNDNAENSHLKGKISRYAWGEDYHSIIREKLQTFADKLHGSEIALLTRKERHRIYRVFVDSGPVAEKLWAQKAGIGWQGKHTNIITKERGSWGFLGEIITRKVFDVYDERHGDFCGSCTACMDACPTHAIFKPYELDASKCISYGTIELDPKIAMPVKIAQNQGQWLFGCDICQDVCPWNRFQVESEETRFHVLPNLKKPLQLESMTRDTFENQFHKSLLLRPHLDGLKRNIKSRDSHV
jgi:epoxyqueuosine reductase